MFVSDPDVLQGSGLLEVRLSVQNGTLSLATTAGLAFTLGDGTADSSMTFTGLITNVSVALSNLTYLPNQDSLKPDAVAITVNDLGNSGSGGPQIVSGSVPLNPLTGQVLLQTNPTSPKLKDLVVYGTDADDTITVTGGGTCKITRIGDSTITKSKVTGRVLVFGLDGNDQLNLAKVSRSTVIDGGAGDDSLIGGPKNDRLTGGIGDDTLDGGKGIDRIVESGDVDFILTQDSLSGLGNDTLVNNSIEEAELTGGVGDNTIDATAFTGKTTLSGGAGADILRAGSGNSLLLGGDGDDQLIGGVGRDVLIGGLGTDGLLGGDGEDILIGGTTIYDGNRVAIDAIVREWGGRASYAVRIKHLLGEAKGGLNKSYFLNTATVSADGLANVLTGGQGLDWFFAKNQIDSVQDLNLGGTETEKFLN